MQVRISGDASGLKRATRDAEGALSRLNSRGGRNKVTLDADTSRFKRGVDDADSSLTRLRAGFGNSASGSRVFANAISLVKFPAMITGAGLAAQSLSALGAGAVATTSALGPLAGSLAALPAIASAAAQGMGVVKLASGGIMEALTAAGKASAGAGASATKSMESQRAAAETLRSAKIGLSNAQRAARDAQLALTQARSDARRELEDMRLATERGAIAEKQSINSVKDARLQLNEVLADPDATALQVSDARLRVRQAKQDLADTRVQTQREREDYAQARKTGIDGMQGVVSARKSVADASRQVAEAQHQVAQASRKADTELSGAAGGADAFAAAMAKLPPAAQQFVRFLLTLKPQLKDLQQTAAAGLFPGVERGITSAVRNFGVVKTVVGQTAQALGGLAAQAGRMLGSGPWGKDMATQGARNAETIKRVGGVALNLADALRNVVLAAGPLVNWMTRMAVGWSEQIKGVAQTGRETGKLAGFFELTRATMERVFSIAGSLATAFWQIGKAAAPLGREILAAIDSSAKSFAAWTASASGKNTLADYFKQARGPIFELGRLVGDVVKAFFRLGNQPGVESLIRIVRTELLPVIENVVATTTKAFGPSLVRALANIFKLFGSLAGTNGPLTTFVRIVGEAAGALARLIKNNPALQSTLITLAGGAAVLKAMQFGGAITGVTKLASAFAGLATRAKTAATASKGVTTASTVSSATSVVPTPFGRKGPQSPALGPQSPIGKTASSGAKATKAAPIAKAAGAGAGLAGLATMVNPVTAVIAAVAALGVGLVIAYKKSEQFRNVVNSAFSAVGAVVTQVVNAVRPEFDKLKAALGGGGGSGVGAALANIGTAFQSVFEGVILPVVRRVLPGVIQILQGAIRVITGIVNVFSGVLTGDWRKAWDGIKGIVSGVFKAIGGILRAATAPFREAVSQIAGAVGKGLGKALGFFASLPGKIFNFLKAAIVRVARWERDLIGKAADAGRGFIRKVVDFVSDLPGKVWNFLKKVIGKVAQWERDLVKKAIEAARGFINTVVNFVGGLPGKVWDLLKKVVVKVAQWERNLIEKAIDAGRSFNRKVIDFVSDLPGKVWNLLKKVVSRAGDFAGDLGRKGKDAGARIVSGLVGALSALPGKLFELGKNAAGSVVRGLKSAGGAVGKAIRAIPGLARGGRVDSPVFIVGEEAPRHQEYVISTNPRDRSRMVPLVVEAAEALGILGHKKGKGKGKKKGTGYLSIPREGFGQQVSRSDIALAEAEATAQTADDIRALEYRRDALINNRLGIIDGRLKAIGKTKATGTPAQRPKIRAKLYEERGALFVEKANLIRERNQIAGQIAELKKVEPPDPPEPSESPESPDAPPRPESEEPNALEPIDRSADLEAQLNQANERARVSQRAAQLSEQTLRAFGSSGDLGTGGANARAAAGGPTIVIQTLHPGDPATLSAIASASNAGNSYQGTKTTPRSVTGV